MPREGSERSFRAYAAGVTAISAATTEQRERALEILLGPDLEPIVDMVAWSPARDTYEAASADGSVRFRRTAEPDGGFAVESVEGQNPLAVQDPTRFGDLASERETPTPAGTPTATRAGTNSSPRSSTIPRHPICA